MNLRAPGSYYGEIAHSLASGDLLLSETRHPAHTRAPWHRHEQPYFCFVLNGGWEESSARGSRAFAPGNYTFHAPDDSHANLVGGTSARCFNVELGPTWSERLARVEPRLARTGMGRDPAAWPIVSGLLRELREPDELTAEAVRAGVTLWLALAAREPDDQALSPRLAERAAEIFRARLGQPGLTLTEVAAELGASPSQLHRAFRSALGVAPGEYLRRERIRRAMTALAHTDTPIAIVATECGLTDQSHLCRLFRARVGTSPAAYRARHWVGEPRPHPSRRQVQDGKGTIR